MADKNDTANTPCACNGDSQCDGRRDSKKLRLVAMVSGGGTTVKNIHECIERGELNAEVVAVIASRDCRGVSWADEAGIPSHIVRRGDFGSVDEFSAALNTIVLPYEADLVILAGYLQLWRYPRQFDGRVMNIHPALLPGFGGRGMWGHHVHEAVLAAGCKVSGCTVHFCDFQYDTGPIIVQRTVPVEDSDTADDLAARVFQQECIAYPEAIRLFAADRLQIDGRIVRIRKE